MTRDNDMQGQGGQGSENLEREQQSNRTTSDIQNESGQDMESRRAQNQNEESEAER